MKPTQFIKLARKPCEMAIVASLSLAVSNIALADMNTMFNNIGQRMSTYTLDCAHWYAGGNIGISHLHDDPNSGSGNSVDENGPGWSVVGGYQFNSILGAEMGYTQYHDSRETSGSTVIAKTEHYAVHLAATGRYPLVDKLSALGKLGAAYSYAQKIATASGVAKSSGAGSLYWGLGLDYSITPKVDFIAQFAEAVGNDYTGSTDLWSVGLNVAIA
ncbi:outer membrane beta-barrel protein [Aquicella lusitana]|uniref:OmpA family protein n=1 Tax=Aquicella lusitana TaxID=254246 RepID=A0A370GMP0_9COXI|nr:outer membrane beta-barrel protein [Aquicella lusitana]RDI44559.1 OmpA family protein [Aquicella lusitana]VVC72499.1 Outer membrane protein A [Aquicella lusitana]